MTGLKKLLETITNNTLEASNLRQLVITSMGHLLSSFKNNPAPIENDLKDIINFFMGLQAKIDKEDFQHKAILKVYSILCNSLQEKFQEYVPFLIEYV